MSKNVIILSYYFPPMGMGGTQRAAKFAKYLHRFNWNAIVVTVKNVRYYAHDDSLLEEIRHVPVIRTGSLDPLRIVHKLSHKKKKTDSDQHVAGSNPSRTFMNRLNDRISGWIFIPDNKILWLPFAIYRSWRVIRRNRVKVIFTTSPPQSVHLAGFFISKLTGVKWVADFRDAWTEGESQANPTLLHARINRFLERWVLRRADRVIGMCAHLTDSLKQKSGSKQDKFITIMNGYDRDDFESLLNTGLEEKFTITHCGSISKVSSPEPFLKAFRLLIDEHEELRQDIHVQYFGIDIFGELNRLITELDLGDYIRPMTYLSHKEALKKIMGSHLLQITIIKKSAEEVISGKIFEYLGSGKPILLISRGGFVANLIKKLNRGTVIAENDIITIKNVIYNYYHAYKLNKYVLEPPLAINEFDREMLTGQLADVFNKLL
ncbi:glycosyltransferase [candidate division KSB1 bacterium]|nr:glycosyltransferase [candidate division KSB1 bacterium]